ncbi:MAG: hypothetical protein RLZ23_589 [Actinomycetota bacterium]
MDKLAKIAVTAINDSHRESFISASLVRQGWSVDHRALTYGDLQRYLSTNENEDLLILLSSDLKGYRAESEINKGRRILVDFLPENDYQLAEIISATYARSEISRINLPENVSVTTVISGSSGAGATTIAINLAQEYAARGEKTLLIDSNLRNPALARYFDIYGVARERKSIMENLQICEVPHRDFIAEFSFDCEGIDRVIIDCGEIDNPDDVLTGRRLGDLAFQWSARHADELFVALDFIRFQRDFNSARVESLLKLALKAPLQFLINQTPPMSKRDRQVLEMRIEERLPWGSRTLSRDVRGVASAFSSRSTLALAAAKSPLRKEIIALLSSR